VRQCAAITAPRACRGNAWSGCQMSRSRFLLVILLVVAGLALVAGSYEMGRRMRPHGYIYYVQGSLALGDYKYYGIITDFLQQKCYDDALALAKYQRDLKRSVVAVNMRLSGNDPALLEYIKLRDPELLKSVLAGHPPEAPGPIWTTCPSSFDAHRPR